MRVLFQDKYLHKRHNPSHKKHFESGAKCIGHPVFKDESEHRCQGVKGAYDCDNKACKLNLAKIKYNKDWMQIRGKRIATVFQDPMTSLNPIVTIGKQITSIILKHQQCSKLEARRRALVLMQKVGIPNAEKRFDDYPFQYSGGMRQRIVIAMALACEPDILIADEPTTALDVTIQAQILDLMADLQRELGMAIIMITHDLGVVAQMCDEVIVMYAGSICEQGTADEIFYNPRHEYTKGLLRSIPTLDNEGKKLEPISGTPIDLLNMPAGCPFAPRCDAAMKICLRECPTRMQINDDHAAACWMTVKAGVEDGTIEMLPPEEPAEAVPEETTEGGEEA